MRTKTVLRHYCDFCNKGFFKKPSAVKHENSCTKNPNRGCGLCGNTGRDYPELIKAMEPFKSFQQSGRDGDYENEDFFTLSEEGLRALQNVVNCCPCCTLAVLRQGKMECFNHFNYKEAFGGFVSPSQEADIRNF